MESVTIVSEPLLHRDFVQFEILVPILERLRAKYDITLAAPSIAPAVQEELESRGIRAVDGGARFPRIRRSRDEIPSFATSWARDAIWGLNRRDIERALQGTDGIRVNVSMTTAIDADVWLVQSRPQGMAFDALRRGVSLPLRLGLGAASPFVGRLDHHHMLDAGRRARERYTTTQHVADWFAANGLPVTGVMPMYYRSTIRRSSQLPSRDYIFVYVGKETDSSALRMLLDTDLPVTMFGSKSAGWVKKALQLQRYPHARLLGHVSDEELSSLYTNARFVAFPFTEEPFGLVPLESMACGTPVLTYGEQGPGESVLDGRTGWLVHSAAEFVRRAVELWNAGPPSTVVAQQCLARARAYHLDSVRAGWNHLFETAIWRREERIPSRRPRSVAVPQPPLAVGISPHVRAFALAPGLDRSLPRPDLGMYSVPPGATLTGPSPPFARAPSPLSRSGAYHDSGSAGAPGYPGETELREDPMRTPADLEAPGESGSPLSPAILRRDTSEGTASSLL